MSGLTLLYRGQLASCNFDCVYCPFAKQRDSIAVQRADRRSVERFVSWCASAAYAPLSVFFTPWGEAMVRGWYRDAVVGLSHLAHVRRVAVQTNLSVAATWLDHAVPDRVGVWATWHPAQMPMERFVRRARRVHASGAHLSVGIVGLPEHASAAARLRDALEGVYVWVNAVKRDPQARAHAWGSVDSLYGWNTQAWPSLGRACRTGEEVVAVDGAGDVRRCHFVPEVIANLYDGSLGRALVARACPNATCGCHIGYVHLKELGLDSVFGEGILERIPARHGSPNRTPTSPGPPPGG